MVFRKLLTVQRIYLVFLRVSCRIEWIQETVLFGITLCAVEVFLA